MPINTNYRQKLNYSLHYNFNEFDMIQEINKNEIRENISGNISYTLRNNSKINGSIGYNSRRINDWENNWFSGNISFFKSIGALSISTSINYFDSKASLLAALQ